VLYFFIAASVALKLHDVPRKFKPQTAVDSRLDAPQP
jgi:hypothetical protein